MDNNSTRNLVSDILRGRTDRFAELISEFERPVYNLALRMTGLEADAADLTQDIFLRVWLNLDKYDPDRKFFTWLYTLAVNLIRNHLKKKVPRVFDDLSAQEHRQPDASGEGDPSVALAAKQQSLKIQELLLRLPLEQREAIFLRFFGDLPFEEIAAILGVTPGAAKMRVRRGLLRLRNLLDELPP